MNGPEHYCEAERLLLRVFPETLGRGEPAKANVRGALVVQAAAVHAQLAAVALEYDALPPDIRNDQAWANATTA